MVGMGSSLAMTTLPDQTGMPPERTLDCAELVRLHPWATTSLGPAEAWDPVVRATVDMLLGSLVPMVLAYGDGHVMIYNDAYAEVLGARHPAALGRPAAEIFGEQWQAPGVGGVIADVYRSGQPFLEAETQVAVARGGAGHVEQASFTRGHSVIRDVHGGIAGVLTVAAETTQVTRRLQSLGDLTARLASALTIDDVARVVLSYGMTSFDVDHCVFAVDDGAEFRYVRRIRGEMMDEADEPRPRLADGDRRADRPADLPGRRRPAR
jgi:predicted amidohydrolase YtcJ